MPDKLHFDALPSDRKQSAVLLAHDIEKLVYRFSTSTQGGTPQAAVATPLALAIHLNVASVTGFKMPLSDALPPHFEWYDKIFDASLERSAAWWLRRYTGQRDVLLSRIRNFQLGKETGFDPVKQRSDHPGLVWICHMEGDKAVGPPGRKQVRADTPGQAFLVWRFLSRSPDGYPMSKPTGEFGSPPFCDLYVDFLEDA